LPPKPKLLPKINNLAHMLLLPLSQCWVCGRKDKEILERTTVVTFRAPTDPMQSGNPHGSKQDIGTPILFGNRNADEIIGVPRTVSPNSSRQLPLDSVSKFSGSRSVGALHVSLSLFNTATNPIGTHQFGSSAPEDTLRNAQLILLHLWVHSRTHKAATYFKAMMLMLI
jgi:hypothetical protein